MNTLPSVLRRAVLLAFVALAALLSSCASSPEPRDYAAEQPHLDLRQYFNGKLIAHGVFTDRGGQVKKRFVVQLLGHWQGSEGVLEEDFVYSDGSRQRRVWHLSDLGQGRWRGRADDVVGEASGEAAGNALRWRYTLNLPVDGAVYQVDFEDWMWLIDERVMLNRARMSKFGVHLGDVTLSFEKLP
ncbi:DUF3833 domain-containing protein [Paucibacter sp. APW11]|uniref:DUF3833 domain-containing protein n=1 Tax=Roseateles aquae TaxID=3077235 RepID=A0ABU3PAA0_9BURK|nr:DUF3833 domain-containing protein [Paucibacter sp. APW11]MDT8999464.1 DUF3833 domain-containing protein [Paucibacter sp. APW11]